MTCGCGYSEHACEHVDNGDVSVNGVTIDEDAIAREMQYHPSTSQEQSMFLATQALVIRELLRQQLHACDESCNTQEDIQDEESRIQSLLNDVVQCETPTVDHCVRYYNNNPRKFTSAPLLFVRHILLGCPEEEKSACIETAQGLIAQLKQDPDRFAALAEQHSDCPSRHQGGSLGQISSGQTVPEFERQLFRLATGLAEAPVMSRYGVHVVMVDQHIEGKRLPFEKVEAQIRRELHERAWCTGVATYIGELIDAATIVGFRPQSLSRME